MSCGEDIFILLHAIAWIVEIFDSTSGICNFIYLQYKSPDSTGVKRNL